MTTIKMNSSYLEVVDRLYTRRGTYIYGGFIFLWLSLFVTYLTIVVTNNAPIIAFVAACLAFYIPFYGSTYIFFKVELFNLTHNPIRFDRRNRMVYAFLYNKEVVAVPWDDVFFTVGRTGGRGYAEVDIRGNIMAKDGATVQATFALGHLDNFNGELRSYWNFIRIYMEKGPKNLVNKFRFCLPIADRKEPLVWGINNFVRDLGPMFYVIFPLMVMGIVGRFLAMHTSRTPVWPEWVEDKCKIEPDDPYVRDASQNPPVYPFRNHSESQLCSTPYKSRFTVLGIIGIICASVTGCITTGLALWLIYTIKMNI